MIVAGILLCGALPKGAQVRVAAQDTSKMDVSAVTLAEIVAEGRGPEIPFQLGVDCSGLRPGTTVSLSATIRQDGSLLFINDRHIAIPCDGGREAVNLGRIQLLDTRRR